MKTKTLRTTLPALEKLSLAGIVALLVFSLFHFSYNLKAAASVQPTMNASISDNSLSTGEEAEISIIIDNPAGNTINDLLFRAFFEDSQNPASFRVLTKADSLSEQDENIALSVPSGNYLDYVEGSTRYSFGTGGAVTDTATISDINGVSPLAFEDGYVVNNVIGDSRVVLSFKVRAVSEKPVVFHPQIDFFKYVANISRGQDFDDELTTAEIADDEVVAVQLFIHNAVLQSTAHNVMVEDTRPDTNVNLGAEARSAEDSTKTALVRINSGIAADLNIVPGSVVVRDVNGTILKTLTSSEVNALFGEGLALNGNGVLQGCWDFMRSIEYKVTLKDVGEPGGELSIDKKVIFEGTEYDNVSASVHIYDPGETVNFKFYVKNISDRTIDNVTLEDFLPTYINYVSGGTYHSGTRTVTYNIGDLDAGEEVTLELTAQIKAALPNGDRTQEDIATVCGEGVVCRTDTALIWINGPDVVVNTVNVNRNVNENVNRNENENENENINRNVNENENTNENTNRNESVNKTTNKVTNRVESDVKGTTTTKTTKKTTTTTTTKGGKKFEDVKELPVNGPADVVMETIMRAFWGLVR